MAHDKPQQYLVLSTVQQGSVFLLLWIRFGMLEINSFFQGHVSQPMEIVNQICHQVVAVDLSIKSNQAITTQEESRGSNSIII